MPKWKFLSPEASLIHSMFKQNTVAVNKKIASKFPAAKTKRKDLAMEDSASLPSGQICFSAETWSLQVLDLRGNSVVPGKGNLVRIIFSPVKVALTFQSHCSFLSPNDQQLP